MKQNMEALQSSFTKKNNILQNARKTLKTEFFGIDAIIDEVIDNVSSWYTLSHLQERPVVINLWGLTGTGKSSLVKRLAELLNYNELYHHFDLGVSSGEMSFRRSFTELCDAKDDEPLLIALDEFQHARTLTGSGPFTAEIEEDRNRQIWELIDSGKIRYIDWGRRLWGFDDMIKKLEYLLESGIEVRNGLVHQGKKLYCDEFEMKYRSNSKVYFIQKRYYEDIIEFAGNELKFQLVKELEALLTKMSGPESIKFMKKVMRIGQKPRTKDFSKSLIFILGNLDEAYPMSSDFTAEIDADEFHEMSQKITVPVIKNALRTRFRSEQIARLGNIHVIYPALNKASYVQIIQKELGLMKEGLASTLHKAIDFDPSVNDLLYSEGVYPTQGVRPLLTTIHQILKSNFSHFIYEIIEKMDSIDSLYFSIENQKLICSYRKDEQEIYHKEVMVNCGLANLRQNKMDDEQAITAVHESGHAILSIVLLSTVPELILSITSDADNNGFVYTKPKRKFITRNDIKKRVAMMLGGLVAEELIFGEENLSGGSGSDIQSATKMLSAYYKSGGFGTTPIFYALHTQNETHAFHQVEEIEQEIKGIIEEGKELARTTLMEEKELLLAMANHLADHTSLRKNEIIQLVEEFAVNKDSMNRDLSFFRQTLKDQFENNQGVLKELRQGICLNNKSA